MLPKIKHKHFSVCRTSCSLLASWAVSTYSDLCRTSRSLLASWGVSPYSDLCRTLRSLLASAPVQLKFPSHVPVEALRLRHCFQKEGRKPLGVGQRSSGGSAAPSIFHLVSPQFFPEEHGCFPTTRVFAWLTQASRALYLQCFLAGLN